MRVCALKRIAKREFDSTTAAAAAAAASSSRRRQVNAQLSPVITRQPGHANDGWLYPALVSRATLPCLYSTQNHIRWILYMLPITRRHATNKNYYANGRILITLAASNQTWHNNSNYANCRIGYASCLPQQTKSMPHNDNYRYAMTCIMAAAAAGACSARVPEHTKQQTA